MMLFYNNGGNFVIYNILYFYNAANQQYEKGKLVTGDRIRFIRYINLKTSIYKQIKKMERQMKE